MDFVFDLDENKEKIDEYKVFLKELKGTKGALIPALHRAQDDFGYIPTEIQELISKVLYIPISEVYGVTTFYSQFSLVPKGENKVSLCLGTACYVKGAQDILEEFSKELKIKTGETTEDLLFSIIETRCIGDCALAPVVTVNDEVYAHFDKKDVKKLLDDIREREEN